MFYTQRPVSAFYTTPLLLPVDSARLAELASMLSLCLLSSQQAPGRIWSVYLIDMLHCRTDVRLHLAAFGNLPVTWREEDLVWP